MGLQCSRALPPEVSASLVVAILVSWFYHSIAAEPSDWISLLCHLLFISKVSMECFVLNKVCWHLSYCDHWMLHCLPLGSVTISSRPSWQKSYSGQYGGVSTTEDAEISSSILSMFYTRRNLDQSNSTDMSPIIGSDNSIVGCDLIISVLTFYESLFTLKFQAHDI